MIGADWLTRAEQLARTFRATTRGERGAGHSVYVILLHDPARVGRWGLYVGQTARDPDWRFDQHKAGYKASGAVRRYGTRLLPELYAHLNPMRAWESIEIEAGLAEALRDEITPWVEGGH
jgi:predicted GIY-YIG superfamily endonuclease